jgi:hypothetical protein
MSNYDSLLAEAEAFDGETDIPDEVFEEAFQMLDKKRKLPAEENTDQPIDEKRQIKSPSFLADFFSPSNENVSRNSNAGAGAHVVIQAADIIGSRCYKCNQAGHYGKECTMAVNASTTPLLTINNATTGPDCDCALPSIQRTTIKEGPNKDRKFWVRIFY